MPPEFLVLEARIINKVTGYVSSGGVLLVIQTN